MFTAIRRKPAQDGYFLSAVTVCNGNIFRREDLIPTDLKSVSLVEWIAAKMEEQREQVAVAVHAELKRDIEMDIALAQRNGTDE